MPKTQFKHCPKCGSDALSYDDFKMFRCPDCNFVYFHNVASAVAGILRYNGKVVLTVRAEDPHNGLLDLPGGFVDPGESAEHALIREAKEELDLDLSEIKYLYTFPSTYLFKGITYHSCDLFFEAELDHINFKLDKSEIADVVLVNEDSIDYEKIAFDSIREGLREYFE